MIEAAFLLAALAEPPAFVKGPLHKGAAGKAFHIIAGASDEEEMPTKATWKMSDWKPADYAHYKDIQQAVNKSLVPLTVALQLLARHSPRRLGIIANNFAYHLIAVADHYSVLIRRQRGLTPAQMSAFWELVVLDMARTLEKVDAFLIRQEKAINAIHAAHPEITLDQEFMRKRVGITRELNKGA